MARRAELVLQHATRTRKKLHRDIKPYNFAMGRRSDNSHQTVYLLDFGLSRKFVPHSGPVRPRRMRRRTRCVLQLELRAPRHYVQCRNTHGDEEQGTIILMRE